MPEASASKELLLADLEHFGEAIWRNEEIGEKRFNFFLTLVTLVAGGLVAVSTKEGGADPAQLKELTCWASLVLLIFGLVTYRRMIHRDGVTAEYKATTHRIRGKYKEVFKDACPELMTYRLPLEDKNDETQNDSPVVKRLRRIFQFGYTPTLGVFNGTLLSVVLESSGTSLRLAAGVGVVAALVLCVIGSASYDTP